MKKLLHVGLFSLYVCLVIPSSAQVVKYSGMTAKHTDVKNPLSPDPVFSCRWDRTSVSDDLETYSLPPKSFDLSDEAGIEVLKKDGDTIFTVKGEGDIRFNFGQNNAGWLEFESPDMDGDVEMSVSEFNEPQLHLSSYPSKTAKPKKYGKTYRLELNPALYEGVQFGWIHVRSSKKLWHITKVRLVCQIRPTNYRGSFACSDSMLTRIWYTGAYTVKLNLLKDYFGAILMDRSDRYSWTGDAHPAQAASLVAFGNYDLVKQNLTYTSTQNNGIRSYSLYWVLSLIDHYRYSGDTATIAGFIDNACAKLDEAFRVYGKNPALMFYGWDERLGAGFEHPDNAEAQNAYKMLSIRAWREFSIAMKTLGRDALYEKYDRFASEKMARLNEDRAWYRPFGLHAAADAANTGLLTLAEKRELFRQSFSDRVNRVSYSPFNQYFIIQALATMQRYDEAISSILDLWGGQIRYGGTTFFEVYRPSWNDAIEKNAPVPNNQCGFTSLCHPWGAGVTKWLSEEVLGIKPTTPGFATVDILPNLGRHLTSVQGTMPTPKGLISASFDLKEGQCSITLPHGVTGRIGIPKAERTIRSILVNGKNIKVTALSQDDRFIYLQGLKSGTYHIKVQYEGKTPIPEEDRVSYPASFLGIDRITGGNWGGRYGRDGYLLCNYRGEGQHLEQLPSYVSSVTFYKKNGNNLPLHAIWTSNTTDQRALASSPDNGMRRVAAAVYAMDNDQTGITYTTTLHTTPGKRYKVSLYFVDWDDRGREVGVEMFDAATLQLIAPVKVVRDLHKGAYVTFVYDRPAKFRINIVRGANAALSGLFFDPAD